MSEQQLPTLLAGGVQWTMAVSCGWRVTCGGRGVALRGRGACVHPSTTVAKCELDVSGGAIVR